MTSGRCAGATRRLWSSVPVGHQPARVYPYQPNPAVRKESETDAYDNTRRLRTLRDVF
jgi:hypothetical protein